MTTDQIVQWFQSKLEQYSDDYAEGIIGKGKTARRETLTDIQNDHGNSSREAQTRGFIESSKGYAAIEPILNTFEKTKTEEYEKAKTKEIKESSRPAEVEIAQFYPDPTKNKLEELKEDTSFEKVSDNIGKFFDQRNLDGIRSIETFTSKEREYKENLLYNLSGVMFREARDAKNIARLRELRDIASPEWRGDIDREIIKSRGG